MKSLLKIIVHALKLVQESFECFASNPNAHGTFLNLQIKINLKIRISETSRAIKSKHVTYSYFYDVEYTVEKT